jgi:hypothetical protein
MSTEAIANNDKVNDRTTNSEWLLVRFQEMVVSGPNQSLQLSNRPQIPRHFLSIRKKNLLDFKRLSLFSSMNYASI